MNLQITTPPLYVRVRDRKLSLWQSAVAETIRKTSKSRNMDEILTHPMMRAVNRHVLLHKQGFFEHLGAAPDDVETRRAYMSYLSFQRCIGRTEDEGLLERLLDAISKVEIFALEVLGDLFGDDVRPFSDDDPAWLSCMSTYLAYEALTDGTMLYNDWTTAGSNDLNYGVIDYELPSKCKVAIIGDWGTGLNDAKCLLEDIIKNHSPDAIIHLGDIYYSGTPDECRYNFVNVFKDAIKEYNDGSWIPVFTIPGNHDYYAWGAGFYPMLAQLNPDSAQRQQASYFCLRTTDRRWQFLAMDTGFNDSDPIDELDSSLTGPSLQANEILWHRDKLENFDGSTIILSHHQLYSANATINGTASVYSDFPYRNQYLFDTFEKYFSSKIAFWLWGHEHNLGLYEGDLFGLQAGRLIGCSAYEELQSSDPNKILAREVPYLDNTSFGEKLGTNVGSDGNTYYNHAYAVIELDGSQASGPATIVYYEFPSWYDGSSEPEEPRRIFREEIPPKGATAHSDSAAEA